MAVRAEEGSVNESHDSLVYCATRQVAILAGGQGFAALLSGLKAT